MSNYVVKIDKFEGPLELLLNLIEKRKLHINDVSLAKVADDYVSYIKNTHDFPMSETANFILIASTLLLIKSKSLLPSLNLTQEEEDGVRDLELRLKIYQRFKEVSILLRDIFSKQIIFLQSEKKEVIVFAPHEQITTETLLNSIKSVIKNLPKKEFIPKAVVAKVINIEEVINNLTDRIQKNLRISFKEFSNMGKEEKVYVIVSFLAMLELVKQGVANVIQEKQFDDIFIETEKIGVPKYS